MKKYLAIFLLFISYAAFATPRQDKSLSPELKNRIISTIKETQANIYDYNNDDQINCIDYACLFKLTWDKKCQEYNCIIVRNFNKVTGMNHLFVRIYAEGLINDIEPWAPSPYNFDMKAVWGINIIRVIITMERRENGWEKNNDFP